MPVFVSSDGGETITTPTRHAPARALITLPAGSPDTALAVVGAPGAQASSVTGRPAGRHFTAECVPPIPRSAHALRIPIPCRCAVVTRRAEGSGAARRRRRVELDRLTATRR
jgi:hypothetical protein